MNPIVEKIMEIEHFRELTPIQKEVLKVANKKRDIIGVSSSGKPMRFSCLFLNKLIQI